MIEFKMDGRLAELRSIFKNKLNGETIQPESRAVSMSCLPIKFPKGMTRKQIKNFLIQNAQKIGECKMQMEYNSEIFFLKKAEVWSLNNGDDFYVLPINEQK